MEKVTELAFELHDLLMNSEQYKKLKLAEKNMKEDSNAASLIEKYHNLLSKSINIKTEKMNKELHQAKLEMDLNNLVIAYKKAFKEYQLLVDEITSIVFKDFSSITKIDKIIKMK